MHKYSIFISLILFASSICATEYTDIDIKNIIHTDLDRTGCTCNFNLESGNDTALYYVPHAKEPHAVINLGGKNIKIYFNPSKGQNPDPRRIPCIKGQKQSLAWSASNLKVKADLLVIGTGAENCSYKGKLSIFTMSSSKQESIWGECGC